MAMQPTEYQARCRGVESPTQYYPQRRWVPHSYKTMELNFNEADFLMHCIECFVAFEEVAFTDQERKEVVLNSQQITDLFLRIQSERNATS